MMPGKQAASCSNCGAALPAYRGNGRPRIRCYACASDRAGYLRAWKAAHPQAAARYEANRRRKQEAR
jgi:hypothetical protein